MGSFVIRSMVRLMSSYLVSSLWLCVLVLAPVAVRAAEISPADACQSKPQRLKGESVAAYGERIAKSVKGLRTLFGEANPLPPPQPLTLPGFLRSISELEKLPSCPLADAWEQELLTQNIALPAEGTEFIVCATRGRTDTVEKALKIKGVLTSQNMRSFVSFGGASHSDKRRACTHIRVPVVLTLAEYEALQTTLRDEMFEARYPVLVKHNQLGEPLLAEQIRSLCKSLREVTGSSGDRYSSISVAGLVPELARLPKLLANVPSEAVPLLTNRFVADYHFTEACMPVAK